MFNDRRSNVTDNELKEAQKIMRLLGYSNLRIATNAGMVARCLRWYELSKGRNENE